MKATITKPEILDRLVADLEPLPCDRIDTIIELIAEAAEGGDIKPVTDYIDAEIQKGRAEIVSGLLSLIMSHPQPALTCACIGVAAKLNIIQGKSEADIARDFGITKSAVCQRVGILRKKLGL